MTKSTDAGNSMECSQNWKVLKQELKIKNSEKKRYRKRKGCNESQNSYPSKKRKSKKLVSEANKPTAFDANPTVTLTKQKCKTVRSSQKHLLIAVQSDSKENSNEIWFDTNNAAVRNIISVGSSGALSNEESRNRELVKSFASSELTKIIGMDCALVGVGEMKESVLARVSIVNRHGVCVYDKFVKTKEPVTDYRTHVSGVRASDMNNAEEYEKVQQEVSDVLLGRILVGHSLHQSLKALFLNHPSKDTRDIARQSLFKSFSSSRKPSLRLLCKKFLDIEIQKGRRDTAENAQAAMKLFIMHKRDWGHIRSKKRYNKLQARKKHPNTK